MKKVRLYESFHGIEIEDNKLYEATVEMDAMDPDNKEFLKFLKKNRVKIINTEMAGPGGNTPVITMQGKRKDLERVLADEELGWADPDLAEYIEEAILIEAAGDFAGWIAIDHKGTRLEIKADEAKDLWAAKKLAIAKLRVPKSKEGMLAIAPAVEESVEVNEARSINKIKKEYDKVINDMAETVTNWKAAKESGDAKAEANFLARLKEMTAKKKALISELDDAVGLKDIDAELAESNNIEEDYVSEAIAVTGKRDANKVMKAYQGFFNAHPALGFNAMGVPVTHHIGAVKELYKLAMIDANFGREADTTSNAMKGRLFPVEVKVAELNNTKIKISTGKLQSLIEDHANAISGAAKFSGLAIVEGTALYLDSINHGKYAEDLITRFNSAN